MKTFFIFSQKNFLGKFSPKLKNFRRELSELEK